MVQDPVTISAGVNMAVVSSKLNEAIQPSDTVIIKEYRNGDFNCNSFVGMVYEIRSAYDIQFNNTNSSFHPSVIPSFNTNQPLVGIQLYRTCLDIDEEYKRDEELSNIAVGITELAATNAVIWVHPDQIDDLAYIIHKQDVIDYRYGSIANRANFYVLRHMCYCYVNTNLISTRGNNNNRSYQYIPYDYKEYKSLQRDNSATTRTLETLTIIGKASEQMLCKSTKLTSTVASSINLGMGQFKHIQRTIEQQQEDDIKIKTTNINTIKKIQHCDMSLETKSLPTKKTTIKVNSSNGYKAIRKSFGSTVGVGLNKKYPKAPPNKKKKSKILSMQRSDTIKMVDIEVNKDQDKSKGSSFLKLVFDERQGKLTMSMRCTPVVVKSCKSDKLANYVKSNVPFLDHAIQEGIICEINDKFWEVVQVFGKYCTIKRKDGQEEQTVMRDSLLDKVYLS